MIIMEQVQSTNIKAVGYDPTNQELQVEFNNGRKYAYYKVPKALYESLLAAESKGKFINQFVIRRFDYAKLA